MGLEITTRDLRDVNGPAKGAAIRDARAGIEWGGSSQGMSFWGRVSKYPFDDSTYILIGNPLDKDARYEDNPLDEGARFDNKPLE